MNIRVNRLDAETIVDIYKLSEQGKKYSWIAKKHHMTWNGVLGVNRSMKRYLFQFNDIDKKLATYTKARDLILNASPVVIKNKGIEPLTSQNEPKFDFAKNLEQAMENLKTAISDYVVAEVQARCSETLKENRELKEIVNEAKTDNWVKNINKRLNGEV